jgi:hypothetical protein
MPKSFQQIIDYTTHEGSPCGPTYARIIFRHGVRRKTWVYHRHVKPHASFGSYPQRNLEDAHQWARELEGMPRTSWSVRHVLESSYSPTWFNMDLTQITRPLIHTTHGQNCPSRGPLLGEGFAYAIQFRD